MHLGVGADMLDEFGLIEGVGDDFSIVMAVNRDSGFTSARLVGIFVEILATATLATVTATAIVAGIIMASAGHFRSKANKTELVVRSQLPFLQKLSSIFFWSIFLRYFFRYPRELSPLCN
jgi:hypothetical protein